MTIQNPQKIKVACVVFNNVYSDARVLKEAEALDNLGFQVKIFGVQNTSHKDKPTTKLPVWRFDWVKYANRNVKTLKIFFLFTYLLLSIFYLISISGLMSDLTFGSIVTKTLGSTFGSTLDSN
jgi:hypothetical protein